MSIFDKYIDANYKYNAHCTSVYDGDTITCDIKFGFNIIKTNEKIRLYGINTPELHGSDEEKEKGKIARDFLKQFILDKDFILYTIRDKDDKYGRKLGIIVYENLNINEELVKNGHAQYYLII